MTLPDGRDERVARPLERLSAYLDGELSAAEREAVEVELATDAELRAELNAYKRLSNELRVDDADRRAARAIGEQLRRAPRGRRRWLPLMPLAAALVLTALLVRPAAQPETITSDDLFGQYAEAVLALGE